MKGILPKGAIIKRAKTAGLLGALLLLLVQPTLASDDMRGFVLSAGCFNCHGPGGASPGSIPSLNHLDAEQIASALRDFRDNNRPATVMGRLARGYSDDEIGTIAAWLTKTRDGEGSTP